MGRNSRREYLAAIRKRYRGASRKKKGEILAEVCEVLKCHRKSATRLLALLGEDGGKGQASKSEEGRRLGRPSQVTQSDIRILTRLAKACRWPCGRRFVVMLPLWIDFDEQRYQDYEEDQKSRLLMMSSASLDRHLQASRQRAGIKGKSGTKPGSLLKTQIPIRSGPWEVTGPGYLEMDTVAHCGDSLAGQFAWSLTMTDIFSTWTECRAVWHKHVTEVRDAIIDIDKALPFTIKGVDSDNGSEFINYTLVKYFETHTDKPSFTRSRPYKKNDQAYVEQKNWTHVRLLLGYARIDNRNVVEALNALYRNEVSWMNNLFTPTMKLKSKKRVGSRIIKTYEAPKTPLQRLLEHPGCQAQKEYYQSHAASLNPLELRDSIDAKIKDIAEMLR